MPPEGSYIAPPTEPVPRKSFKDEFWETVRIIVISLAIVVPVRVFIAQPFIVRGQSMEPNFHDGEYLIVDELSYRLHQPTRGDVVVLRYPLNPQEYFIKRLIGFPGETVAIEDGSVFIEHNGTREQVKEPYLPGGTVTLANQRRTLGGGEYFVLGDNRGNSHDSRAWGALPKGDLIGRVFIRLWPLGHFGVL